MYILNSQKDKLFNTDYLVGISISNKKNAFVVMAGYCDGRVITMARCKTMQEAKAAINSLFEAISNGEAGFAMLPDQEKDS